MHIAPIKEKFTILALVSFFGDKFFFRKIMEEALKSG